MTMIRLASHLPLYRVARHTGLMGLILVAWYLLLVPGAVATAPDTSATGDHHLEPRVYLPLIWAPDPFPLAGSDPIWTGSDAPDAHEVVLFRHAFMLEEPVKEATLELFADTRYSVWVNGRWQGRGPARFSRTVHEYDTYPLGDLEPGHHVIAVLVQWAPNERRSDSVFPHLIAQIQGVQAGASVALARTGDSWKARHAAAWRSDSPLVHEWGLIGPTEMVDLRHLPDQWTALRYDDSSWDRAVNLSHSTAALMPRSIPHLEDVPLAPLAVTSTGMLSPGRELIDFEHSTSSGASEWQELRLEVFRETSLQLEAVEGGAFRLDGEVLPAMIALDDPARPDVRVLSVPLLPGRHTLDVEVPVSGRTLSITMDGLTFEHPFSARHRAAERMLLAEPVPSAGITTFIHNEGAEIYVAPGASRYLILDMGSVIYGRPAIEIEGAPGAVVDIGWDERLLHGRPLPAPGSLHFGLWQQVDSWTMDGTPRQITTIDARAGRYLLLHFWGGGEFYLRQAHVREERYPVEQSGTFNSSNERLNEIWQVGLNTLRSNMTDAYADPWRERGQWLGDALAAFYANRVTFGDSALLERALRQFAEHFGPDGKPAPHAPGPRDSTMLLDYGMLWVEGLYELWKYTGDTSLVVELYPDAMRLMDYVESYENDVHLIDMPLGRHWSQSALIDWSGASSRDGQSTALNALYAATLARMSEMSLVVGEQDLSLAYAERGEAVSAAIGDDLYLNDFDGYTASQDVNGARAPAPQAQAWALAYDIVPESRRGLVADALIRQTQPPYSSATHPGVEIYGMRWVFEALAKTGRLDEAVAMMERYYGAMLDAGATTWWESFNAAQRYDASLSHAWGSSPTWILSAYLLGAQQSAPGQWLVAPTPAGGTTWASGSIPMQPAGQLRVAWQDEQCGGFELAIEAPPDTVGGIEIPLRSPDAIVRLNGTVVWNHGSAAATNAASTLGKLTLSALRGGEHQLSVEYGSCE